MKNKMTMAGFGPWLQEKTGAELKELPGRTECVVSIDHIEPGCFAALFVVTATNGLKVFELCGWFPDTAAAWQALACHGETYPPLLFEEWVTQQYLTDRKATVEKLTLGDVPEMSFCTG
ncbi:MAG: hypothetical protein H6Q64_714 [Firmicutes bacterium]|nr:hypothetical protein [Bacillota bacterium]